MGGAIINDIDTIEKLHRSFDHEIPALLKECNVDEIRYPSDIVSSITEQDVDQLCQRFAPTIPVALHLANLHDILNPRPGIYADLSSLYLASNFPSAFQYKGDAGGLVKSLKRLEAEGARSALIFFTLQYGRREELSGHHSRRSKKHDSEKPEQALRYAKQVKKAIQRVCDVVEDYRVRTNPNGPYFLPEGETPDDHKTLGPLSQKAARAVCDNLGPDGTNALRSISISLDDVISELDELPEIPDPTAMSEIGIPSRRNAHTDGLKQAFRLVENLLRQRKLRSSYGVRQETEKLFRLAGVEIKATAVEMDDARRYNV